MKQLIAKIIAAPTNIPRRADVNFPYIIKLLVSYSMWPLSVSFSLFLSFQQTKLGT